MIPGQAVDGIYVEVRVPASGETEEAVCDFLFSEGALGLVTEDGPGPPGHVVIRASFGAGVPVEPLLEHLSRYRACLAELGLPAADGQVEVLVRPLQDWGRTWKEHFTPLPVGRRLLIVPPWEQESFPAERIPICIEPAMAFGTGHHGTTRMCLEALEGFMAEWPGDRGPLVMDLGTGTGILAIAAAALGAWRVIALDTDAEAVEAAKHNLVLNKAEGCVEVSQAGIDVLKPGLRFDLILANLDTGTLCPILGMLREQLVPGGRLIVSGIPIEDQERVSDAARAARLALLSQRAEDGWLCLTLAQTDRL